MPSAFARNPGTIEEVVAEVRVRAGEECPAGGCPIAPRLNGCVRDAVDAVWDVRVTTFVPVLAWRRVRACIRAGTCGRDDF